MTGSAVVDLQRQRQAREERPKGGHLATGGEDASGIAKSRAGR